MTDALLPVVTRFRAYQLGTAGSSFSYVAGDHFTLIEARITEKSLPQLQAELKVCGKKTIDTLHITSWDQDHCAQSDLDWILTRLQPSRVEYPGYSPHTDTGKNCLAMLKRYLNDQKALRRQVTLQRVDPDYINGLDVAKSAAYKNIYYHPKVLYDDNSNNNSTVKLFRSGMFNVASLGDVEHPNIGSMLRRCRVFSSETDVLILAHHGADNGLTTKRFLEMVKPSLAICSSDYDNQYDHPAPDIRSDLHDLKIPIYTTKTGDVIIESLASHRADYKVWNLKTDSTAISSHQTFRSRKFGLLTKNADTIRNIRHPGFKKFS
jgi:competence protein ComEC